MIYVIQTKPQLENILQHHLLQAGYLAVVAKEEQQYRKGGQWKTQTRIIMPGYVFIAMRSAITASDYYIIKKMPGYLRFLEATPLPLPLPQDEEDNVMWLWNGNSPLQVSKLAHGQDVKVVAGALVGREGQIVNINRRQRRCTILVKTHGVYHRINLSIKLLKPF